MGLIYRKRVRLGRRTHANLSGGGVSITRKWGPVTVNSRGHVHVRIAPGLSWRIL